MSTATATPFEVVRRIGRFVSGVTGSDRYERYIEHLRRVHPERPVPSRADFWRAHYAEQERNPGTRCC